MIGGLIVMHDADGCNSTYDTHDEPRWYDTPSMVYVSGINEIDTIQGNDQRLIDNIAAYTIAMPGAELLQVRRVNHPLRKILPDDEVVFEVHDQAGELLRTISLRGDEIRKKGLWKDITNKALSGLPGVQKEGTDGIITSAEFVLYKNYPK